MSQDSTNPRPTLLETEVERWIEDTVSRFMPPLQFPEIRRGVHAVSSLYVQGRKKKNLSGRAVMGEGKKAAFATYYGPLHFLTVYPVVADWLKNCPNPPERILDLGCGTGACGAAIALALQHTFPDLAPPEVSCLDQSPWALGEAKKTYRAFGLEAKTKKGTLPRDFPRTRKADCIVLGWAVNELSRESNTVLLSKLASALQEPLTIFIFEPLSSKLSPWWDSWASRLSPAGVISKIFKTEQERPKWIEKLDHASGLDHRILGARVLHSAGQKVEAVATKE